MSGVRTPIIERPRPSPQHRRAENYTLKSEATYLGLDHVGRYGSNLEVLVKILDAGQRLAVHVHLTRAVPASI